MKVQEIWTSLDFEVMGWHDSRIYSITLPDENFQLAFDIDYTFKWERSSGSIVGFWVSPCDLIFKNISHFKMEVDYSDTNLLFISDIRRRNERLTPNRKFTQWDYEIECDAGLITFSSIGFEQKVRKQPVLSESQDLDIHR
tara:strand:- start:616 stop:1038 length:423 start_codon:yes stop_codon:yes gene_type:complete